MYSFDSKCVGFIPNQITVEIRVIENKDQLDFPFWPEFDLLTKVNDCGMHCC